MTPVARLGLAVSVVLMVALAIWGLIRMRRRVRGSLEDFCLPLLKEPDALYRDGKVIARVEGATVDEARKSVHFERLTGTINLLNLGADVLDYRRYRLRCVAVESITGSPPAPYRYQKVTCNIVGQA